MAVHTVLKMAFGVNLCTFLLISWYKAEKRAWGSDSGSFLRERWMRREQCPKIGKEWKKKEGEESSNLNKCAFQIHLTKEKKKIQSGMSFWDK